MTNIAVSTRRYQLTPHEHVEVLRATPELLEAEVRYDPGGRAPVRHRHPEQFERFVVLEGRVRMTVGRETRVLHPGDTATVGRGRPHTMAADGDQPARMIWQTCPALDTEGWWAGLDALATEHGGEPPLPAIARLLVRHGREFELALPGPLPRIAARLLAALPVRTAQPPATVRADADA